MEEWRSKIVERIQCLYPKRIFEFGVGNGLLLSKLVDNCISYHATDLSSLSLQYISDHLPSLGNQKAKVVLVNFNDFIEHIQHHQYDTIIINSVTQYLPSGKYLKDIINKLSTSLVEGGSIFIGDVRNYDLLPQFNLQKDKISNKPKCSNNKEKELLFHPHFFFQINPSLRAVVLLKDLSSDSELARYRYDVILKHNTESYLNQKETLSTIQWNGMKEFKKYLSINDSILIITTIPYSKILQLTDAYYKEDNKGMQEETSPFIIGYHAKTAGWFCEPFLDLNSSLYFSVFLHKKKYINVYNYLSNPCLYGTLKQDDLLYNQPYHIVGTDNQTIKYIKKYYTERMASMESIHNHEVYLIDQVKSKAIQHQSQEKEDFVNTHVLNRSSFKRELLKWISQTVKIPYEVIDDERTLYEYGIDSLDIITLGSMIYRSFGIEINSFTLTQLGSIKAISAFVLNTSSIQHRSNHVITITNSFPLLPSHKEKILENTIPELQCVNNIVYTISLNLPFVKRVWKDWIYHLLNIHRGLHFHFFENHATLKNNPCCIRFINISDYNMDVLVHQLQKTHINLAQDELLKIYIIHDSSITKYVLIFFHHILLDFQSLEIFSKQLINGYKCIVEIEKEYKVNTVSFEEFIENEIGNISKEAYKIALTKIAQKLTKQERIVKFNHWSSCHSYVSDVFQWQFPPILFDKTFKYAKKKNLTPYSIFLAVFMRVIQIISQQNYFVIGIVHSKRSLPKFASTVGLLRDTVLLTHIPGVTIEELANHIHSSLWSSMVYSYDLHHCIEQITQKKELLFNVMFDYTRSLEEMSIGAIANVAIMKRHLNFRINENAKSGIVRYRIAMFSVADIKGIVKLYMDHLTSVVNSY